MTEEALTVKVREIECFFFIFLLSPIVILLNCKLKVVSPFLPRLLPFTPTFWRTKLKTVAKGN